MNKRAKRLSVVITSMFILAGINSLQAMNNGDNKQNNRNKIYLSLRNPNTISFSNNIKNQEETNINNNNNYGGDIEGEEGEEGEEKYEEQGGIEGEEDGEHYEEQGDIEGEEQYEEQYEEQVEEEDLKHPNENNINENNMVDSNVNNGIDNNISDSNKINNNMINNEENVELENCNKEEVNNTRGGKLSSSLPVGASRGYFDNNNVDVNSKFNNNIINNNNNNVINNLKDSLISTNKVKIKDSINLNSSKNILGDLDNILEDTPKPPEEQDSQPNEEQDPNFSYNDFVNSSPRGVEDGYVQRCKISANDFYTLLGHFRDSESVKIVNDIKNLNKDLFKTKYRSIELAGDIIGVLASVYDTNRKDITNYVFINYSKVDSNIGQFNRIIEKSMEEEIERLSEKVSDKFSRKTTINVRKYALDKNGIHSMN